MSHVYHVSLDISQHENNPAAPGSKAASLLAECKQIQIQGSKFSAPLRAVDGFNLVVPGRCHMPVSDSLPEWSKGVDSSSTSASCVGSNPTAVTLRLGARPACKHSCPRPATLHHQQGRMHRQCRPSAGCCVLRCCCGVVVFFKLLKATARGFEPLRAEPNGFRVISLAARTHCLRMR